MYNILICDDEHDIVNSLNIYLTAEGYKVTCSYNGKEAVSLASKEQFHLILLDVMMPVMDGIAALSAIRETSNVPIILLTAKSEDTDKVLGLNLGADDYITKPFNPVEMLARVRSQLRRYTQLGGHVKSEAVITIGSITLDDDEKKVTVDGDPVALTPTEYEILKLFMKNPGSVYSPRDIYAIVWNDVPYGSENTVAVHIRHLREKIEINPAEPRYLKVVWGQGYKIQI
ncbi:MAG: response regulator transcription factor [Clostridia bacterium]|nr:response regulator transcription factor [Clostridia bacterium]